MGIIRILLAIAVVLTHSSGIFGNTLVEGHLAVQLFYIISGFYMSLILNEKYIDQNGGYGLFISNRLMRLFPIYWAVVLLLVGMSLVVYFGSHGKQFGFFDIYHQYYGSMSASTIFFIIFTNIFLIFQDIVMFLGVNTTTGGLFFTSNFHNTSPELYKFLLVPQAWTIGVEITFYLIAPFLVRRNPRTIVLLIAASLGLRAILYANGLNRDPWTYRFFPTELTFFLLGNLSYAIYNKIRNQPIPKNFSYALWIGMLAVIVTYNYYSFPYRDVMLFTAFFLSIPFIFKLSKRWKIDRYIGELSYPIYISHMLLLLLINKYHVPVLSSIGLTVTLASIAFSMFLNEIITKPIEKLRQQRVNRVVTEEPVLSPNPL
jgi:peptidoglycan/LPS O-acetylase OafA/YrhL